MTDNNDNLYQTRNARRHIRDSGVGDNGPAHNADQVAFDNTETGLDATDVQAAIGELAGLDPTAAANEYTDEAIATLIGEAPELLDTLGEIAAALGNDEDLATTLLNAINDKADDDHTHTLAELTDVDLSTEPADGDALVWDDTAEAWVAGEVAGGSGGASVSIATVTAYNQATREASITYLDDTTATQVRNRTAFTPQVNDTVAVATLADATPVIVSVEPTNSPSAQAAFTQLLAAPGYPETSLSHNGGWATTTTAAGDNGMMSVLGPTATVDVDNILGMGAGALVVCGSRRTQTTSTSFVTEASSSYNIYVYDPNNRNTFTTLMPSSNQAVLHAFFFGGALWAVTFWSTTPSTPTTLLTTQSNLRRYNADTQTWSTVTTINNYPEVIGSRMWLCSGLSNYTLSYIDAANITTVVNLGTAVSFSGGRNFAAGGNYAWCRGLTSSSATRFQWADLTSTTTGWVTGSATRVHDVPYNDLFAAPSTQVGAVDTDGNYWVAAQETLRYLDRAGGITTYANVLPTDPNLGAPVGLRSRLIQGPGTNVFYFGACIKASVVGGSETAFRAAVWRVTPTGSARVWTDTVDSVALDNTATVRGYPSALGLSRVGNTLYFQISQPSTANSSLARSAVGAIDITDAA
jgi:hypothetical protein